MPRHHRWHTWVPSDETSARPVTIRHWPEVKTVAGLWQPSCVCGWVGQPRVEWPDANTDAAIHANEGR